MLPWRPTTGAEISAHLHDLDSDELRTTEDPGRYTRRTDEGPRSAWARTRSMPQLSEVHSTVVRVHTCATSASDPMTHSVVRGSGPAASAASHLDGSLRRIAWRNVKHGHCRARPPKEHPFNAAHSSRAAAPLSLPRYRANADASSRAPRILSHSSSQPEPAPGLSPKHWNC